MAAAVRPGHQGTGLAGKALSALRERAASAGLQRVIAPVRPTLKSRYPLTPMENFARWTRPDGLHLDPWVRAHQRLGASILGPAPRSMTITGTDAENPGQMPCGLLSVCKTVLTADQAQLGRRVQ